MNDSNVIDIVSSGNSNSLEAILTRMAKYGKVRLGQYGDRGTWSCSVEMNIRLLGVEFEIKSGFDHPTPASAALKCDELMQEAILKIKDSI